MLTDSRNDVFAVGKLRAYVRSESADAKLAFKSAVPSVKASYLRYVTRAEITDLNNLNHAKLLLRVAPLIEEAQTRAKMSIEASADRMYARNKATKSVNMQRNQISVLPNRPRVWVMQ